jgi:hypothetical protein
MPALANLVAHLKAIANILLGRTQHDRCQAAWSRISATWLFSCWASIIAAALPDRALLSVMLPQPW